MFNKIITLIAAMALLTACSDNEEVKTSSEVADTLQSNEILTNQQSKEMNVDVNNSEWASLPEYNKIVDQLNNQDYTFETETDNEGKRVLNIIDKNGEKQYKSVFIKNTCRLKIIKLDGGGLIFNGTLS